MTGAPIFRKTMRDTKWMLIGMAGGIFVYALVIVLIYPLFKEDLAAFDDSGSLDGFLGSTTSIASPEGYIQSQMFIFTPILVVIMAIITGSAAFVGEQDSGTMDIVLAQPVARKRLAVEKTDALTLGVLVACVAHWPGVELAKVFVEFDISSRDVLGATIMTIPVSMLFLTGALLASAALPTRGAAAMALTAITVVTYFANIIGATSDSLEWLQWISPFYWSDSSLPLVEAFPWARFIILMAIAAVMGVATIFVFDHRDIASGNRELSLVKIFFGWVPLRRDGARQPADATQSPAIGR